MLISSNLSKALRLHSSKLKVLFLGCLNIRQAVRQLLPCQLHHLPHHHLGQLWVTDLLFKELWDRELLLRVLLLRVLLLRELRDLLLKVLETFSRLRLGSSLVWEVLVGQVAKMCMEMLC